MKYRVRSRPTRTSKLQTRQTQSTNYTQHIILPSFVSEQTISPQNTSLNTNRLRTKQSVSTAPTVTRPLTTSYCIADCMKHQNQTAASSTNNAQQAIWIYHTTATNRNLIYISHEQTWQGGGIVPKSGGPRKMSKGKVSRRKRFTLHTSRSGVHLCGLAFWQLLQLSRNRSTFSFTSHAFTRGRESA